MTIAAIQKRCSSGVRYTSRIQKGGALLDDMRLLVRSWSNGCATQQRNSIVAENVLGKGSRARAEDTYRRAFLPRFIQGSPPEAWKIVRHLEERDVPIDVLRPVYYWITARSEPLLYDFVCEEMTHRDVQQVITTHETANWIATRLSTCGKTWSPTVTRKVAQGLLATLRDFGILQGRAKKRVAASYLPIESFSYIAFALHEEGVSGKQLVEHSDWRLFLLSSPAVERMFLEADRAGLLRFHAAGRIVRVDFAAQDTTEMADVVTRRAH